MPLPLALENAKSQYGIVGRDSELSLLWLSLTSGRSILIEGPVGVGKTLLAQAAAQPLGRPVIRVDGDGRYTEQKLVGSWDPQLVLEKGYTRESFRPGPLARALEEGAVLFMNELNRMPEAVQNVLLPALDEKLIQVPQLGTLGAKPGFVLIGTQNPRDFVGTSYLSEALIDRLEWLSIGYPAPQDEIRTVSSKFPQSDQVDLLPWIEQAVALVQLTRTYPKLKRGASIRAAIAWIELFRSAKSAHSGDQSELFWSLASTVFANRIELMPGAYSSSGYPDQLKALLFELRAELKKKSPLK